MDSKIYIREAEMDIPAIVAAAQARKPRPSLAARIVRIAKKG